MATDKTGGSAFPAKIYVGHDQYHHHEGMTLRQWYIGMALQGTALAVAASRYTDREIPASQILKAAQSIADAAIELEGKDHD
jgi:hypothetical protein